MHASVVRNIHTCMYANLLAPAPAAGKFLIILHATSWIVLIRGSLVRRGRQEPVGHASTCAMEHISRPLGGAAYTPTIVIFGPGPVSSESRTAAIRLTHVYHRLNIPITELLTCLQ